ncbi:MAG: energy-coupled thiamine transporter ThiT [Defluviitaleaceae bacterium]|nr:energy-coupled thiamine transporter ThiT [Defluviitaleaceae bacterium]
MQQKGQMSHAKMLAVGAVCIALAFMLNQVAIFRMPMGGSVTPMSMLFIVLAGYWLGPAFGILAGVSLGLLDTITGAFIVHPAQYVLDYILGFGALGISGFFRRMKFGLQIGYIAGVFGRWVMVFLSGLLFFYMYAPEGQHAAIYSAVYNLNYIAPEMIVTLIIISLPSMKHAINIVTKSIVPPAVYEQMLAVNAGSVSAAARIATGAVLGTLGGMAFVFAGHLRRLEELTVMQVAFDVQAFSDPIRADRVYRLVERNSEQIFAFQTAGVIFLALAAALMISTLCAEREKAREEA